MPLYEWCYSENIPIVIRCFSYDSPNSDSMFYGMVDEIIQIRGQNSFLTHFVYKFFHMYKNVFFYVFRDISIILRPNLKITISPDAPWSGSQIPDTIVKIGFKMTFLSQKCTFSSQSLYLGHFGPDFDDPPLPDCLLTPSINSARQNHFSKNFFL